ncbi:MAG: HD domain-containing protein [Peptococcaceae bacterium]|jgi:response regulator RpfG family c-di-GMP phosphodiesterase|nr:HD domain-containing protein [Peptococcaceae bacterium]
MTGSGTTSAAEKEVLMLASLVHDMGVSTWRGREALHRFEVENPWEHCQAGSELVRQVRFLEPLAPIVLSHHDHFAGGNRSGLSGDSIPLPARIIHLADRVDVSLSYDRHVLLQVDDVVGRVRGLAGRHFDPAAVAALVGLARRESFWMGFPDAICLDRSLSDACTVAALGLDETDMLQMAGMFASVIDKKSRFTHRHSYHVAGVAVVLAGALNFPRDDIVLVEVAGLMHDLGKLSVPDGILEKPGPLTSDEFAVMRQHTFYRDWAGKPTALAVG